MELSRRDLFKVAGISLVATTLNASSTKENKVLKTKPKLPHVVVVGGGVGGLVFAKNLAIKNKNVEITLLEKRELFHSCPYSNLYLGDVKNITLEDLTHDYYKAASKYGYDFISCEVMDINRKTKTIFTSKGEIEYDLLVLSPGIGYNYEEQFSGISEKEAREFLHQATPAMMSSSEHLALKRELENFKGGNVIITVPEGKYRCPPAPYERACMIANLIKKKKLKAKVIILDYTKKPRAKSDAFLEAFSELYSDIISFIGEAEIENVDLKNKTLKYRTYKNYEDYEGTATTLKYEILNLIPIQKASPVIKMANLKADSWGGALMEGASYRSKSDGDVYVLGDCMSYTFPPSAQMAIATAKICANFINSRLRGEKEVLELPGNVCYSLVGENPQEAIAVAHEVSYDKTGMHVKAFMNKTDGKYRSQELAQSAHEWYKNLIDEMFG